MAMYHCKGCSELLDDDYFPMEESEMCPACHLERMEAIREDREDGRREEARIEALENAAVLGEEE